MKMSCESRSRSTPPAASAQPDLDHLARIIPLVHGRGRVEALVALQPDQRLAESRRQHLRDLGLAHAGLAFEEQRPLQLEREEHGGREPAVGDIILRGQEVDGCVDGGGQRDEYGLRRHGGGHRAERNLPSIAIAGARAHAAPNRMPSSACAGERRCIEALVCGRPAARPCRRRRLAWRLESSAVGEARQHGERAGDHRLPGRRCPTARTSRRDRGRRLRPASPSRPSRP